MDWEIESQAALEDPDGKAAEKNGRELPLVISLQSPLRHGSEDVREIVFKRPLKVRDLRGVKVTSLTFDDFALVIGRLVGLPTSVIEQMELWDFGSAMEVVSDFLGSGPVTGSKS